MTSDRIKLLAYKALPYLVRSAQQRKTLYYGELGDYLKVNPHTVLPHVLGFIRDDICDPNHLPRINAIVISKSTDLPGIGFIPEGITGFTDDEIKRKYEQFRDETFKYHGWEDLLKSLGLSPLPASVIEMDKEAREYNLILQRSGDQVGGEQEEHKKLKYFIANQPQLLGISAIKKPSIEYEFLSSDRCDILIEVIGNKSAVIEIKIGQRGELIKGIYQLIKYRALLAAEKAHGETYPVDVYLVAYSIPTDIQEFASKFSIYCYEISKDKVFITSK
jgi:hypothetical protein